MRDNSTMHDDGLRALLVPRTADEANEARRLFRFVIRKTGEYGQESAAISCYSVAPFIRPPIQQIIYP